MNFVALIMPDRKEQLVDNCLIRRQTLTPMLMAVGATKVLVAASPSMNGGSSPVCEGFGLLSWLHTAVCTFPQEHFLCVPSDVPGLSRELLRWLVITGQSHQRSCHYRHHDLPLYLHNDETLRSVLQNSLRSQGDCQEDPLDIFNGLALVAPDPYLLIAQ
ncbi:hypothetical protein P2G88_04085 [Aliiglaciecola sp. CAU 1673]|uniref:hypothetical protein n=1 Tax=Aliiglaciecola sp. CAU 1673 TaxID=3032595 RepID=UPI0023DBAED3|nr:hypothetical protein [Aliiglaciecola sp. CAU 1673]MDF2177424.1 hypothetical protein [Aliiglaciecola sp. CAU 1673]